MAQRILGLDLGASAVKAVLLESTFRGWTVLDAARAPLPDGVAGPGRHAAAVRALLEARGWSHDAAVVAFPGTGSTSVVTLPFADPRRIEQTVGFEVEGQIPFDLAEVAWDWQPMTVREGKTELLVAVVRKEELAGLLAALGDVGVDPRAVLPAGPAYASLFAAGALAALAPSAQPEAAAPESAGALATVPGASHPAEILVDIGHERTSVAVISAGSCEDARTFAFGSAHLVRALARALGIAEADATALLTAEALGAPAPEPIAGLAADPRAADALRRALVPLVREVRATLRAWHARAGARPVARLLLAGAVARLPGLADVLAPEVEGPVAPIAFAGPAEKLGEADAPGLTLALALALRGHLGARAGRLNLRRGELAYTRDFEHLKGRVARLGAYAALVVVVAILSAGVKVFALSRQEAALDRALCDAETKIVGRCYPNFEEAQAVLRGKSGLGATLPRVSAVDLLAELSAKNPEGVQVRFDRIEITKDKLHLQGSTDAAENVDRIASSLKSSRCFADARSGGARRRGSDGKFEFSIDASLTCLDSGRDSTPGGR
jgi:general secretion pathway protein L